MSFVIHAGLFAFDIVMNAITRETWEGQTLFSLQATVHYPGKPKGGNERRTLKQKQWRNTAYWLAHWLMLTYRSHIAQTHLPRDGTAHNGRGPSTATNNQDMAIGLSEPANASFKTPSQVTLHCVSLAITTNQYSFRSAILLGGMADYELGSKYSEASGTFFSTRRLKKSSA